MIRKVTQHHQLLITKGSCINEKLFVVRLKQFVITVYNHFILVAQTDQFLIIRKYGIRITNLLLRVNL